MMERTAERAIAELQAGHALARMLGRVRLEAGDKVAIALTISAPEGNLVAIDRAEITIPETPRK